MNANNEFYFCYVLLVELRAEHDVAAKEYVNEIESHDVVDAHKSQHLNAKKI